MDSASDPDSQEGASDDSGESIESTDAEISADGMEGSAAAAAAVPLNLPEFTDSNKGVGPNGIGLLGDVKLDVKIELGRADMYIEDVLKLGAGAVVQLDKLAGDPVDVLVNDRLVARGEVLVLNDNFCVRISEILPGADEALQAAS
ncbi:MAG: flagellar motor switch protein FliN [Planctomycetes bacterium]|nr:flagellar motor switch protein FliN [Planctomycetota bacterium]